jgi:GrpB-like predicted nucleotidyltransferase (UPF0157 family)
MVNKANKAVMQLVGELRPREDEWNLAEYAGLFKKLGGLPEKADSLSRYVRFSGNAGGRTVMRFLGADLDSIGCIPAGMVAIELEDDRITFLKPASTGPVVVWQGQLTWSWLDRSNKGAPVGDFQTCIPAGLASQQELSHIDFVLTGNACFEKNKSYKDDVRLVEYDPQWPEKYEEMANWLRKTIPPEICLHLEHIGSTAIPGMLAKPVIDILLEVPSLSAARRSLIPVFNNPKCEYWEYSDHMIFIVRKEIMGERTHHIHASGAGFFRERVAFRDYLRSHMEEARRYAALKYDLAARYAIDRETYTSGKADYIRAVTAKALELKDQ